MSFTSAVSRPYLPSSSTAGSIPSTATDYGTLATPNDSVPINTYDTNSVPISYYDTAFEAQTTSGYPSFEPQISASMITGAPTTMIASPMILKSAPTMPYDPFSTLTSAMDTPMITDASMITGAPTTMMADPMIMMSAPTMPYDPFSTLTSASMITEAPMITDEALSFIKSIFPNFAPTNPMNESPMMMPPTQFANLKEVFSSGNMENANMENINMEGIETFITKIKSILPQIINALKSRIANASSAFSQQ